MRYINLDDFKPSNSWLATTEEKKSLLINMTKEQRSSFLKESENKLWNSEPFSNSLKSIGKRKCWYAEVRSEVKLYIDHFRPKLGVSKISGSYNYQEGGIRPLSSGYYWKAYDYKNFRFVNDISNKRKGEYFPLKTGTTSCNSHNENENIEDGNVMLLDPCIQEDVKLLMYNYNMPKPVYTKDENEHNFHRAKISILAYDLENSFLLDSLRRNVLQKCHLLLIEANRFYVNNQFDQFDRPVSFLIEMLNPESEFTMMIYHRLLKSKEEWVEPYVIEIAKERDYL